MIYYLWLSGVLLYLYSNLVYLYFKNKANKWPFRLNHLLIPKTDVLER